jgi:tetratricopeptide (TPR) repeat protein
MPLAVELAATWTRSLGVGEVLKSLERGFDLLSTTQRDIPERHRNMQAVLEYSWTNLGPTEQGLLSRLAVFGGGTTLEAAEQIAGAHLGLLLRLINQALLRRGPDGRYDLHELVRQYARGLLQGEAEEDTELKFCRYYLNLLSTSEALLVGPDQMAVQAQLQSEIENLRQALKLALRHRLWAELEKAFDALHTFFRNLAYFREGQNWFSEVAQALSADLPHPQQPQMLARARLRVAYFARYLEPFSQVEALLQDAIKTLRVHGGHEDLALALQVLGSETRAIGNLSRAEPLIRESCTLSKTLPDPYRYAIALLSLSQLQRDQGRISEAAQTAEESLALRQQMGDLRGIAMVQGHLANLARGLGDLPAARAYSLQALGLKRQLGDQRQVSLELGNLAIYALEGGNLDESEQLFLECLRLKEQLGEYTTLPTTLSNLGELYREQGRFSEAHPMFARALTLAERFGSITQQVLVLVEMAETGRQEGHPATAQTHLRQALSLAHQHDLPPRTIAQALYYLAQVLLPSDPEQAYVLAHFIQTFPGILRSTQTAAEALTHRLDLAPKRKRALEAQAAGLNLKWVLEKQM